MLHKELRSSHVPRRLLDGESPHRLWAYNCITLDSKRPRNYWLYEVLKMDLDSFLDLLSNFDVSCRIYIEFIASSKCSKWGWKCILMFWDYPSLPIWNLEHREHYLGHLLIQTLRRKRMRRQHYVNDYYMHSRTSNVWNRANSATWEQLNKVCRIAVSDA